MAGRGSDSNPLFMEKVPGSLRLAGWVLLLALLILGDVRNQWLAQARAYTGLIFEPVFELMQLPGRIGRGLADWLVEQQALLQQNARLRHENLRLRVQLRQLQALKVEERAIHQLLQSVRAGVENLLVARVVGLNTHPFGTRVLVNRGAEHGVEIGMAALAEEGVAGQVVTVLPGHAWVMLISDADHALPVKVSRTGVRSILVGRGRADSLEAINLPLSADVQVGDRLETSGIGGRFPAHFPVAEVIEVIRKPGERFAHVRARPLAPLERLEFLVLNHFPEHP